MIGEGNSKEFYDNLYKLNPDKWNTPFRDKFAYQIIEAHLKCEPKSVVDLGCGNGHTLAYLSCYWNNAKLYGIDMSDAAIDYASKRYPGIEFVQGYIGTSKVPRCEVVMCMGVMEHFYSQPSALRLLAKHGHMIYLEVPDNLGNRTDEGWRKSPGGQMEWHLRRDTWEKHLADAGYRIIKSLHGPNKASRFVWLLEKYDADRF